MFDTLNTIGYTELAIRVLMAGFFGLCLGVDRDLKGKPVDFRAYMIVCISTCLVAILGGELFEFYNNESKGFVSLDLGKIISGVLSGIGFLGAGAIIKNSDNHNVVGTTTGAGIWGAAIIGLCIGFGQYVLAIAGFIAIALILYLAKVIFDGIHKNKD